MLFYYSTLYLSYIQLVIELLNAHGKIPMFANPASFNNTPFQPIWLNESRLLAALKVCFTSVNLLYFNLTIIYKGTTWSTYYEFMRAELMAENNQIINMLTEGNDGLAAGSIQ